MNVTQLIEAYRDEPSVRRDPYPTYDGIRTDTPVWTSANGVHYLSRHSDISGLLRGTDVSYDPLRSTRVQADIASDPATVDQKRDYVERHRSMGDVDPPTHPRMRGVVADFFSPRAAASMASRIDEVVDRLLREAVARGSFDVVKDLGLLVPVHIVIGQTFDLPLEESNKIASIIPGYLRSLEADVSVDEKANLQAPLYDYATELMHRRRRSPGDDVLSALVRACDEGVLTLDELLANAAILMHGGFDTTKNLIANGVLQLIRHPEQYDLLQADSDDPDLAGSVVDEVLRFDPPAPMTRPRTIAHDVEVSGVRMKGGEQVVPLYAAANRDPERFDDPGRFDITRSPNRHFGFGFGSHLCVGRPLARAEGRSVFAAIARAPRLELDIDEGAIDYRPEILQRTLVELPVTVVDASPGTVRSPRALR